jgi:tripartite-type tricarboxylate transporter receptor subunit TctC
LALSGATSAQENFPNRTVRVVNPYSAGSVADVFGRIVTQHMAARWNASITAEAQVIPWFGIVVPAGTPQPIVARISKELKAALATPAVRNRLDIAGCTAKSASLAELLTSSNRTSRSGQRLSGTQAFRPIDTAALLQPVVSVSPLLCCAPRRLRSSPET